MFNFKKYGEKVAHSLEERNSKKDFKQAFYLSPSAQLPVAKECSPVLSSACTRSQDDMEMNVFLQKSLQHTGHATFSPAMRRLT